MDVVNWVANAADPWVRYRARRDVLDQSDAGSGMRAARTEMLNDPRIKALGTQAATWGQIPLKRHNDAAHPLHTLGVLADFGLRYTDPNGQALAEQLLTHQSPEGAFCTPLQVSSSYGGTGEVQWTWMACDAPVILRILLDLGISVDDPRVARATEHLLSLVDENGWRCIVSADLGRFRGPGRKADPCPIANVYALEALSRVPGLRNHPAADAGIEMLLQHWEHQTERKLYLFGIGTDFRKLKYPCIWYDLLHVLDVLSRFPQACADPRFHEMLRALTDQADANRCYMASSMYRHWKGWCFADKKVPSPWLTLLALRIIKRARI